MPSPDLDYSAPPPKLPASAAESLSDVRGSVAIPHRDGGFWRKWLAFSGPALLVSVGYMDPGNWGTDLQAGAAYKYGLLWVVLLASIMAIFLQVLAARLGVVTGKDLAQACRDWYPAWMRLPQWLLCELAIGACDLAEVLGSAVALNLMFHIPLFLAVCITALDVFLLLALQRFGMRTIEAVVGILVATIAACYFLEIFVLPQLKPNFLEMGAALAHPSLAGGMMYVAIGIVGATVMPHNLYLHSALVQTRKVRKDEESMRSAIRFNTADSVVALTVAFFVNAAILVLAAMVFYGKDHVALPNGHVIPLTADSDWIRVAYATLAPLLGAAGASILFAVALLASGQSSTITGTLAGQVVMEGFMHWKVTPWVRRFVTRALAIMPAVIIIGIRGEGSAVTDLLTLSQVVLALQLPFAMFPLLHFASSRKRMGAWKPGWFLLTAGWASALLITVMDLYGLPAALKESWHILVGG